MISLTPLPPIASVSGTFDLSSRCLKRFIWNIDPSEEAAKKKRSVMSHAKEDIALGNMNVVSIVLEARSHSYYLVSGRLA